MLNEFHEAPGDRQDDAAEDGVDETGVELTAVDGSAVDGTGVDETGMDEPGVDEPGSGTTAAGAAGVHGHGDGGHDDASGERSAVGEEAAALPAEPSPWPRRSGAEAGAGAARAEAGHGAGGPPGEGDFGAWLRRQRELRAIDLREIADKTKISLRYLKAMEQDRFEVLPAPIFARGFLREYAKYVGLDADEVVNYYLAAHQAATDEESEEEGAVAPAGAGPLTRGILIALLLVLVAAVFFYFLIYQRSRHNREEAVPPPIAAPVSPPVTAPERMAVAAEPAAEVPSSAPLVVTLDFTEECWVEAQVDGSERVSRLFVAGESLQLEAQRRVVFDSLGNVGGVEVQVNGRPFSLAGGSGRTARGVVIDLETAAAPPAA